MILTKSGGILGPIASVLGMIMDILFRITEHFGIVNVGLCIILFTIVTKMLMLPLTIKQQKSTKLMSVMNPEIKAIQDKYKGKSDQESMRRQNVEVQAVYEKYGTSMTGGCLPLLIQMPILFALFSVIRNIPAYVPAMKVNFDNVVNALITQNGYVEKITTGITDLSLALNGVAIEKYDFTNADKLVDMLYKFTTAQWAELEAMFPAISTTIAQNATEIAEMNTFLGLNIAEAPGWMPSIAWIIPILAAASQFLSVKILQGKQPQADPDNPTAQSMQTMNNIMPLMSAFFCVTMPIGLGIYWIASSVVQIIQQLFVNAYMERVDIDDMVKKNIEKINKKRAKQGLPPTKATSVSSSLEEVRANQEKAKRAEEKKKEMIQKQVDESNRMYFGNDPKPGSLASKAAMVQKYNEAHDKRNNKK